jgi:hypothetical protein
MGEASQPVSLFMGVLLGAGSGLQVLLHSLCVWLCRTSELLELADASWPLLISGGLLLARKALIYVLAPTCKRQASSESVELARMPFAVKKKRHWFARRGLANLAKLEILLSASAVSEC